MAGRYGRNAEPIEVRGAGEQPTHFLWRDRVYAVREVLGYRREGESGPWREVWQVEASRGRCYAPSVYELSLDRTAGRWTLLGGAEQPNTTSTTS